MAEILDESLIEIFKPQKPLKLLPVFWNWPLCHCSHLFWVGRTLFLLNNEAQKADLLGVKFTLFCLDT